MRIGRWLACAARGSLAAVLCGCATNASAPKGYFGPTLPIDALVQRIDQNNDQLPTLWARHEFEATVVDPDTHKSHFVNGFGTLLYRAPDSLRLVAKKELTDLFDMGTDGAHFWLRLVPEQDEFWWGSLANLDKPGTKPIPVRPDLILEVLGIRPINSGLTTPPVPVMRFNNDADAYMLVWQTPLADHWAPQKEIWYDRATLHPTLVLLFDPNGRVELRAWLSNFKPVPVQGEPRDLWPMAATYYRLFFPETGTKMSFTLTDVTISHNGFPKAISFRMPDPNQLSASGVKVIQVDENSGS
jgi:hypothetical protein